MEINIESTPPTQAEIDAEKRLILSAYIEVQKRNHKIKEISYSLALVITVISILAWQTQLITGEVAVYGAAGVIYLVQLSTVSGLGEFTINRFFRMAVGGLFLALVFILAIISFLFGLTKALDFFSGNIESVPVWPMYVMLYGATCFICISVINRKIESWITSPENYSSISDWKRYLKPLDFKIDSEEYIKIKKWKEENQYIKKYFTNLGRIPIRIEYMTAESYILYGGKYYFECDASASANYSALEKAKEAYKEIIGKEALK